MCIAEGFKKDFDVLCKNTHTVAAAISTGLQISKFYVTESENEVVGVVAISNLWLSEIRTKEKELLHIY